MGNNMEFKVGDKVNWLGSTGELVVIDPNSTHPLEVYFEKHDSTEVFTLDGRYHVEQDPSLKLIERPKKKVKKTTEVWVNIYGPGLGTGEFCHSEKQADTQALKDRIACVKLTGEYEVDEE